MVALLGQVAPQAYARAIGPGEGQESRFPLLGLFIGWNERVMTDKGEIYVSGVTITMAVAFKWTPVAFLFAWTFLPQLWWQTSGSQQYFSRQI